MKFTTILTSATQRLTIVLFAILLASCSSNYQVTTNLDKENFQQYFAPTSVKIYQSEQKFNSAYQFVGAVEGQDCQTKGHHAAPNEITARTHARARAFEKNANAIIFTGCALIADDKSSKQCISTLVCYGKAYFIKPKEQ